MIVTGSHLDPELNGLKLVAAPTYGPLDVNELFKPAEAELAGPAAAAVVNRGCDGLPQPMECSVAIV